VEINKNSTVPYNFQIDVETDINCTDLDFDLSLSVRTVKF
jgi:hypothetical protein